MTGSAIVVLAAGSGSRVGAAVNKVLLPLDGIPLLAHSVRTAIALEDVRRVVVVVRPEDREQVELALSPYLELPPEPEQDSSGGRAQVWLVDGGEERHDSETRALEVLRDDIENGAIGVVAIHDGARPLASAVLFGDVIGTAERYGAAVPALPITGLVALDGAPPPGDLVGVQTPQAFRAPDLVAAYARAAADGFVGTDTAACLERYAAAEIHAVVGEARNVKVTFPEDLALAEELLRSAIG